MANKVEPSTSLNKGEEKNSSNVILKASQTSSIVSILILDVSCLINLFIVEREIPACRAS